MEQVALLHHPTFAGERECSCYHTTMFFCIHAAARRGERTLMPPQDAAQAVVPKERFSHIRPKADACGAGAVVVGVWV